MDNLSKVSRMCKLAFDNGLRLHRDSITLFNKGSLPTAIQLSILAQEEIGKAWLLQDWIFQCRGEPEQVNKNSIDDLLKGLHWHQLKQGIFTKYTGIQFRYRGKRHSRFINELSGGGLEKIKQKATYVGLSEKDGKLEQKGKIVVPYRFATSQMAEKRITWINDNIIELAEGVKREVYGVDSDDLENFLIELNVKEFEIIWPKKGYGSKMALKKIRNYPIENT